MSLSEERVFLKDGDGMVNYDGMFFYPEIKIKEFIRERNIWIERYIKGEIDQYELRVSLRELVGLELTE